MPRRTIACRTSAADLESRDDLRTAHAGKCSHLDRRRGLAAYDLAARDRPAVCNWFRGGSRNGRREGQGFAGGYTFFRNGNSDLRTLTLEHAASALVHGDRDSF